MNLRINYHGWLAAAGILLASALPARAEVLVNENFEYQTGDLVSVSNGAWVKASASVSQNINVGTGALTYQGYQTKAVGNAVKVSATNTEKAQNYVCPLPAINKGKVYMSFLLNVTAAPSDGSPMLIGFNGANSSGAIASTSNIARIHVKKGDSNNTFKLGYTKNASASSISTFYKSDLEIGKTYLIVMSYECVDGATNDVFNVWVSPATDGKESDPDYTQSNTADHTNGIYGVRLMQSYGIHSAPDATIDALRVATTWAELFSDNGGGDTPDPSVAITPSLSSIDFGYILQNQTVERTIKVKATNLTSDITVESSVAGLKLSSTTISKDEACSSTGADLTVTFTPAKTDALPGSVVLKSEGADDVSISLDGTIVPVIDQNSFAFLNNNATDGVYYRYTGTMAKVSFVDAANSKIYIQDMTAAVCIDYSLLDLATCPIVSGDRVKNIFLMKSEDKFTYYAVLPEIGTVTAQNTTIEPNEVSFNDMKNNAEDYLFRLVTVKDVTLQPAEGQKWATTGVAAACEFGDGRVRAFAGTDIIGTDIPVSSPAITGISTSAAAAVLTVRCAADVESVPAGLEITRELKIDANEYQEVGKSVVVATFTVKADALAKPVSLWLGGKDRDQYSISREEIPAGTGTYTVDLTYTPAKTGRHSATLNFDATPTELSSSQAFAFRAFDPANLPVITVDGSALVDFSAKVGEKHTQTVSYTIKNMLDYGTVKVINNGLLQNAFIISSASTPLYDGTYQLTVSFEPKAEGDYSATIEFSADKAETVTVDVKGSTSGGAKPEDKQGDELTFEGPARALYQTDFTNSAAKYKPIKLEGWKNVAAVGTRAWWSFTDDSGNQMAYVTAYDSQASAETDCQMVLLSPRLSFKDAAQRVLAFNVMGKLMTENMTDKLLVAYIGAEEAETASTPDFRVIDGLYLPCTPDENGDWARYVLDCDAWELDDEFYIAFIFQSKRGRDSSAQYFIDDFSWGRTDMPLIRTSHPMLELKAAPGQQVTSEEITISGFNLSEPIRLSLSGTSAKNFTLSTTELPVEGGKFTLDFASDEKQQHTAVVTLLSGSDARTDIPVLADTESAGIGSVDTDAASWADGAVSVFDIQGRVLMSEVPAADALRMMRAARGTLFLVRDAAGTTFRYIAR